MTADISIIIPVYQVEPYIGDCLQSILSQQGNLRTELILVDDCGSDGSMARAADVLQHLPEHISYQMVRHEHNRGLSAARNTGVAAASGTYLLFVDSDDTIYEDALITLWTAAEQNRADMVIGGIEPSVPESYSGYFTPPAEGMVDAETYLSYVFRGKLFATACNRLLRRSWYEQHHLHFEEGLLHEDELWSLMAALCRPSVFILARKTYLYRLNREGSIVSAPTWARVESNLRIYQLVVQAEAPSRVPREPWNKWRRLWRRRSLKVLIAYYFSNSKNPLRQCLRFVFFRSQPAAAFSEMGCWRWNALRWVCRDFIRSLRGRESKPQNVKIM